MGTLTHFAVVTNKHNKNSTIERRFSNRTEYLYTATVGKIRPIGPLPINQIDLAKARELHKTLLDSKPGTY
jgi:hypothetical protein